MLFLWLTYVSLCQQLRFPIRNLLQKGGTMDKPFVLYHGTCNDIAINDYLKTFSNYSRNSMQCINAVFATSNKTKSVYFGLRSCLVGRNSRCKLDNNRIFLSSLRKILKNTFYVYSIDPTDFRLDSKDEYISFKDVQILSVEKYDLKKAITEYGFEIYMIPELDINKSVCNQIKQMNDYIDSNNFQKLDIASIF